MLRLYARARAEGSSSSEPEALGTASPQDGQARADRGGAASKTSNPSSITRPSRSIGSTPAPSPPHSSRPSRQGIEAVKHPVDHDPGQRDVQPDRQRPAGQANVPVEPAAQPLVG